MIYSKDFSVNYRYKISSVHFHHPNERASINIYVAMQYSYTILELQLHVLLIHIAGKYMYTCTHIFFCLSIVILDGNLVTNLVWVTSYIVVKFSIIIVQFSSPSFW